MLQKVCGFLNRLTYGKMSKLGGVFRLPSYVIAFDCPYCKTQLEGLVTLTRELPAGPMPSLTFVPYKRASKMDRSA